MGMSIKQWVAEQPGQNGVVIAELAEAVGVSPAAVRHWISGKRKVPPKRAPLVEVATDGKVTRYILREDVFGTQPQAALEPSNRIDTPEAVALRLGVSRAAEASPSVAPAADPEPAAPGDSRVVPFEAPP